MHIQKSNNFEWLLITIQDPE